MGDLTKNISKLFGREQKPAAAKRALRDPIIDEAIADSDFHGLYIIGPKEGWPVAFGHCKNHADAWASLKRGHWDLHELHFFPWVLGKPLALRIKQKMTQALEKYQQFDNAEWYNLSAEESLLWMRQIAESERIQLFDDVQRQRYIEQRANEKRRQRQLEGPRQVIPVAQKVVQLRPRT